MQFALVNCSDEGRGDYSVRIVKLMPHPFSQDAEIIATVKAAHWAEMAWVAYQISIKVKHIKV